MASDLRSDYVIIHSTSTMKESLNSLQVEVNGCKYTISNIDPKTSLNEWLRGQPGLKGTKVTCQQGGCGSCVVALTKRDPVTKKLKTMAVNSCLFPLYEADGLKITTTEGLGSSRKGYHPIQQRIAEHNGSQCGYCTPGMVMHMYSLLSENSQPSKQQIEDSLDGNICRCTGFRPILDAMNSFAKDERPIDIEDLHKCQFKGRCGDESQTKFCPGSCFNNGQGFRVIWLKAITLKDLYSMLAGYSTESVRLIVGDTGKGVYKNDDDCDVYISIGDIPELNAVKVTSSSLQLGAALSLNSVIQELTTNSEKSKSFEVLASHIKKIANIAVRNVGSWAGNLMLIHRHRDFPSDIYTIMDAVGAKINIGSIDGSETSYSLKSFLLLEMKNKVILNIDIPFSTTDETVKTFKVMPRHQNAHAYVNVGFRASMDANFTIQGVPSLVFGGVKLAPAVGKS